MFIAHGCSLTPGLLDRHRGEWDDGFARLVFLESGNSRVHTGSQK